MYKDDIYRGKQMCTTLEYCISQIARSYFFIIWSLCQYHSILRTIKQFSIIPDGRREEKTIVDMAIE